jgi:hypothetical protein
MCSATQKRDERTENDSATTPAVQATQNMAVSASLPHVLSIESRLRSALRICGADEPASGPQSTMVESSKVVNVNKQRAVHHQPMNSSAFGQNELEQ